MNQVIVTDAPLNESCRFGSGTVFFTYAGTLIAEDIEYTKPYKSIDFANSISQISRAAYSPAKGTGSMVVQLRNIQTYVPVGDFGEFALDDDSGHNIKFIVIGVSTTYTHNGIAKCGLQIVEYINAPFLAT